PDRQRWLDRRTGGAEPPPAHRRQRQRTSQGRGSDRLGPADGDQRQLPRHSYDGGSDRTGLFRLRGGQRDERTGTVVIERSDLIIQRSPPERTPLGHGVGPEHG